jgi:hypothetical protein
VSTQLDPFHPTVVFADLEPWECFLQFGAALRRRGVPVTRLTRADRTLPQVFNDLLQWPVFGRTQPVLGADGRPDPAAVERAVPDSVAAVEAVEDVGSALVGRAVGRLPYEPTSGPPLDELLFDKLAMTGYAERHGLAVPRTWAAEQGTDELPVVFKPRLGLGGRDVEVVRDPAERDRVVRLAQASPGRYLFQEFAPGELVHVGGVARWGTVVQAAAYRAVGSPHSAMGPSSEIQVVADQQVLDQAAALVAALGYTGAFCLDYVRDAGGRALLVDVNARIFGSWKALQDAGLDVVGAYLYAVGFTWEPPTGSARVGATVRTLPHNTVFDGARVGPLLRARMRLVLGAARALGWRWTVAMTLRLVSSAALQSARQVRTRAQPPQRAL